MRLCLTLYGSIPYIYTVQLCIGFVGGFDFPQYPSPVYFPFLYDTVPVMNRDV